MEVSTCWGDFYHPHHPQAFRNHQYLLVVGVLSSHHWICNWNLNGYPDYYIGEVRYG